MTIAALIVLSAVILTRALVVLIRHIRWRGNVRRRTPLIGNGVLALSVSNIGVGAQLRVRGDGVGFEITATLTRPAAPPVRAIALAGTP